MMHGLAWTFAMLVTSTTPPDSVVVTGQAAEGEPPLITSTWKTAPRNFPAIFEQQLGRGDGSCADWSATFHAVGEPPEGDLPSCAAFTLDGTEFIIGHRDSGNLLIYDAATRSFLREVPLSGSPQDLALLPDGIHAVVANLAEDTISLVDLVAAEELEVIEVGTMPGVIAVTADGTKAIVGNAGDSEIAIIDLATGVQVHVIPDAPFTTSITFAPESGAVTLDFSRFAVIGNDTILHPASGNDELLFIDIDTGSVSAVACTNWPRGIAVSDDGLTAVITHYTESIISLVDTAGMSITGTIDIGSDCWGPAALSGDAGKAVIAVLNNCRVVDLDTGEISGDLSTATTYSLFTSNDGQHVFCSGYRGSLIDIDAATILVNVNNTVSTPVAATSPTQPLAVMAANTFAEDMVVANIDGAAGHLVEVLPSGPSPEGDRCRSVAVHEGSGTVVAVNLFSRNAEIINAATGIVEATVPTGLRPSNVEISPDGSQAVIANLDSAFATVIDLSTFGVTEVPISRRASRVVISPDGAYAYVAVVADGDGVWRIDLDTLAASGAKLLTGNMGSVGYPYSQASGLALSPDGSTLVTCDSFDDTMTIIDTASWSIEAFVAVGDFPTTASFSVDGESLFVSLRNADAVAIVDLSGPPSVTATIPVGDAPWETAISEDGTTLYVLNSTDKSLGIIDLPSLAMTNELAMPFTPVGLAISGACVMVATGAASTSAGGSGYSFSQDGALVQVSEGAIVDQVPTGVSASQFAFEGSLAAIASPAGDGVVLLEVAAECSEDINGDGQVAVDDVLAFLAAWGSDDPNADVNGDGTVDTNDILAILAAWGPCN